MGEYILTCGVKQLQGIPFHLERQFNPHAAIGGLEGGGDHLTGQVYGIGAIHLAASSYHSEGALVKGKGPAAAGTAAGVI